MKLQRQVGSTSEKAFELYTKDYRNSWRILRMAGMRSQKYKKEIEEQQDLLENYSIYKSYYLEEFCN